MNLNLIKIFSFFIGLFITLIILSFYKLNEKITIPNNYIENFNNKIDDNFENMANNNDTDDYSLIPYNGYKFMCINTYGSLNKISKINGKWYDVDSNENKIYDFNYNNYFNFNKTINTHHNKVNNNGANGANINDIELNGPSCYNFANNSETYELTTFTMFMTIKINGCSMKNNIIYEMTGNTITINNIIPTYSPSIININLIITEDLNYTIELTIGSIVYKGLIDDIDKAIIEDNDYITIGLYLTDDKIGLLINKKIYEYTNINKYKITLGSTPIIINKNGTINMSLYNFIYYKNLYPFNYYDKITGYNNYYISGLDYINKKCKNNDKEDEDKEDEDKKDEKKEDKKDRIKIPDFKYDEIIDYYTPDILKKIFNY